MTTSKRDWEIFHGASSPAVTRVYLRGSHVKSATLTGPYCEIARTLPTHVAFRPVAGQSDLLEAIFPDLCAWTPETPHWYQLQVTYEADGAERTGEQMWGARRMTTAGGQLFWDGMRSILQVIGYEPFRDVPLGEWRDRGAAMLVTSPDDRLCEQATRYGVPVLAKVPRDRTTQQLATEIQRLAGWPSVTTLVCEASVQIDESVRKLAPNTLLAAPIGDAGGATGGGTTQLLICDEAQLAKRLSNSEPLDRPILVTGEGGDDASFDAAQEAASDLLGRIGRFHQLAGVIVRSKTRNEM